MLRYETLVLTTPEITSDEAQRIEKKLESLVAQNEGKVLSYERWGKYKLAYPVRRNEYGVYFLLRYDVSRDNVDALNAAIDEYFKVKVSDIVMRHVIVKLDPTQPFDYKRPESLEEAPSKDVEVFTKDRSARHNSRPSSREEKSEEAVKAEEVVEKKVEKADEAVKAEA
jgi:small subunit ribosomal protein S6